MYLQYIPVTQLVTILLVNIYIYIYILYMLYCYVYKYIIIDIISGWIGHDYITYTGFVKGFDLFLGKREGVKYLRERYYRL